MGRPGLDGVTDVLAATLKVRGDTAKFYVEVRPQARRQGIGTQVVQQLADEARESGARVFYAWADRGSDGEAFLAARLDRVRGAELWSALDLADAPMPPALPGAMVWTGACPPHLTAALSLCHQEMEAVFDTDPSGVPLTVAVLEGERMVAVAHVTIADAEAHQEWTGVVPSHRGRGIGGSLKAEVIRVLKSGFPEVSRLRTENNAANAPILAANARLGFRVYRDLIAWEMDL